MELLVVDQPDIFLMQNWEHVLVLLSICLDVPIEISGLLEGLYVPVFRWKKENASKMDVDFFLEYIKEFLVS